MDATVISIYDQNISQAVEFMQGYPLRPLREAMLKLGKIMQERLIRSITYPDLSYDFLSSAFDDAIFPETKRPYVQGHMLEQVDLL